MMGEFIVEKNFLKLVFGLIRVIKIKAFENFVLIMQNRKQS